jgi:hypothetical protein
MKIADVKKNYTLIDMLAVALPIIASNLKLTDLPKIKLVKKVPDVSQPTFGRYDNGAKIVYLAIDRRHPIDVIRTLAHEIVHFKQDINNELEINSGQTGSPAENEANALAGVIMRNINKSNPGFILADPISLP